MKHQLQFSIKLILVSLVTINLSACTTLTADLRQRAETVFRDHNQLVSQLILFNTDVELSDAQLESLESSENSMIQACKPLNQVAAKVRDGDRGSLRIRASIPRAIKLCETRTKETQLLLSQISKSVEP